jgi:hypothetical protein
VAAALTLTLTLTRALLAEQVAAAGGVAPLVAALHRATTQQGAGGYPAEALLALRLLRLLCGLHVACAALAVQARVVGPLCALLAESGHAAHALLAADAVVLLRCLSQVNPCRRELQRQGRLQVRFCRYRFSPTGELGYKGIRGAEG